MFLPTEIILRERMEEREREVQRIQLLRLVKDGVSDQLKRHGAWWFQDEQQPPKKTEPSKN